MESLPKSKDGAAAREEERSAKWHLPTNRKHTKTQYVAQPGTRVVVHTLGITFIFEGDRIQLLVDKFNRPKVGYADDALLPSGKRSLALSISNEDGAQLYFDNAAYPNGGEFNQRENRTAAYETWELTPCSYAQFRYKSLDLVYKEGRINIWVDNKTDDSYVLPVKVTNNGRTSYQFYVATHNVNATVSNIISERFFRVRLPGVKHVLLEKTGYHKDQSGSIVLEMSVVKEGRLIGNVSVKAKSSKEKVVPELLAQALFDGSLDLSY
jgi:hypothetical protein